MCKCTPEIRTPYCGRGNCINPHDKPQGARSQLHQDVEEFIAAHLREDPVTIDQFIDVDDLRAWMSGHVRVPVELLTKEGINSAIEMPPEVKGRVMSEMFWRGVYAAQEVMLNASKGERWRR